MHRIAEVVDNPLGALPAGFVLIRVAPFAVQQLLVANSHAPAANPVFAVA
jgi:hypothetical protein